MQEAITWICVHQDLRYFIARLGHNELSPKADFRTVLGSMTGLLVDMMGDCQFLDLVSLVSPPSFLNYIFHSAPQRIWLVI